MIDFEFEFEEAAMMRNFAAMLLLIALPALPVSAGNDGHGHKKSKHDGSESWSNEHDDHDHSPRFSNDDRDSWRGYWNQEYEHGNCPPGLAKKHNGCMPPGQAKKRYRVGHVLPPDIVILPVPVLVLPHLAPCAPGYRYGVIDGDLVKLTVGTLLVVDAIEGLTNR